jgi:hypothetical protein
VYEDLNDIVRLRFGKEMEVIAHQTRQNVEEASNRFAATAGAVIRSGQHEASLARMRIAGVEQMARALFQLWVDLIKQRNGCIARGDVDFIANKIEQFVRAQTTNLKKVLTQQRGGVPSVVQEADRRMHAVSASARRDLEIIAREYEAFPAKAAEEKQPMKQVPKKRFSVGRRVLVGMGMRPATVQSVADAPSTMGEFVHEVLFEGQPQVTRVLGCELQPLPGLDEDLRGNRPTIHIQNSNVANLNLGSQIGNITAALQHISEGDRSQKDFARAMEELTQAVVAASLADADKQEIVDALSTVTDQAAKKPEARSKGTVKAVVAWLPTALSTASQLMTVWDKVGPIIKAHFHI